MSKMANLFLSISKSIAKARSSEPAIITSEHGITIKYETPSKEGNRIWDKSMYSWGNIFIKGYANPVKINVENNENAQMIASQKYKDFMKTKVIRDAFFADTFENKKLLYGIIAGIALQIITLISVIALLGG